MAKSKEDALEKDIKRCLDILENEYTEDSTSNEMDAIMVKVQGILARAVGDKPWK